MKSFPWDSIVEAMGDDGLPIYDRAYSAEDFRNVMQVFFSNGVFINTNTALHVTAGEGMTVTVAPGKGLINGTTAWERESRTLEIVEAESNDRIDTVVLRWDANLEQRKIDLYVRQGISSANPVRPNLTRTESVYELGLADIFIPKNTTSVSGERITDTRLETERCGVASPFMKIDTTTFYSQLEAALEKQTAELQEQTDRAVELAQSAIDGTTAGNLQNQIDAADEEIAETNQKVTNLNILVNNSNAATGERLETLEKRSMKQENVYCDNTYSDGDSPEFWFNKGNLCGQLTYEEPYNMGTFYEGTIISQIAGYEVTQVLFATNGYRYIRSGIYKPASVFPSSSVNAWNNQTVYNMRGWQRILTGDSSASITEDMLSSGLKNAIYQAEQAITSNKNLQPSQRIKGAWANQKSDGTGAYVTVQTADGLYWRSLFNKE